jgi:hypothetical protein
MSSESLLCVVAHDAGGAEVISSYVRRLGLRGVYVLQGPAGKIFKRKLGEIEISSLGEALSQADWLLCGTSWQSELEFDAIKIARTQGKRSVAFLDHWVNYRERFERNGEIHLPDELWVGDADALAIAEKAFPGTQVRLVENPYFLDLRDEIEERKKERNGDSEHVRVLYVCEPIKEHALRRFGNERYWGYTEDDALRYFLDNLAVLGRPVEQIVIRPHPSESQEKYSWVNTEYELPIQLGGARSLIDEIIASDVVVGCASMAMVVALLARKQVMSCIPPSGGSCSLPQVEIIILRDYLCQGKIMQTVPARR